MRIINRLINELFPAQCLVCLKPSDRPGRCLCMDCETFLSSPSSTCQSCGLPLEPGSSPICGNCLKHSPPYETSWSAWWYEAPVDRLLRDIKYHQQLAGARLLGELMAEKILTAELVMPDALLPVPLHRLRLSRRGYNQAVELFRPVSSALGIPLLLDGVLRRRSTPSQVGMDLRARRKNLKGAFHAQKPLPGHIAIVDDVITTGTTVAELALALKRAGVKRVQVWSAARAEAP